MIRSPPMMWSNGHPQGGDSGVVQTGDVSVTAEWREYFLRNLREPRFPWGHRFLRRDISDELRRLIPEDATVLELGVGTGSVLASLPNAVRHGIDLLPEAVDAARQRDPLMRIEQGDALTFSSSERYEAIIADRLLHSVSDVQRMLDNMVLHLKQDGRIYLTCINFLWAAPLDVASRLGFRQRSPEENCFSESTLDNLFALA